jgi:hypothetical protein
MHRKRQSGGDYNDVPVLTDAIDEDDDIPLLTDVDADPSLRDVAVFETVANAIEVHHDELQETPAASPIIDPVLRDQLVHELASRVEERLRAALPQIINSTVKDFLAEQEMIANS